MDQLLELLVTLRATTGSGRHKQGPEVLRDLLRNTDLAKLEDKEAHSLLTSLYVNIKIERSAYVTAKTSIRPSFAVRLNQYGHILLYVVTQCWRIFKFKTIRQFSHHLMETLPMIREILLVPLANTYLRTMQFILDKTCHLDHFDHDLWTELVIFCINSIECYEASNSFDGSDIERSDMNSDDKAIVYKSEVTGLFTCLSHLLAWSPAKFESALDDGLALLQRLLNLIDKFCRMHVQETAGLIHVVSIIKILLQYNRSNHLNLAEALTRICLGIADRHWTSRNTTLCDALIDCLALSEPFFSHVISDRETRSVLGSLYRSVCSGLCRKSERFTIQISDLSFHEIGTVIRLERHDREKPGIAFRLANEHTEKQFIYSSLHLLASLASALAAVRDHDDPACETPETLDRLAIKRQKCSKSEQSSDSLEDLLASSDNKIVVVALQAFTLRCQSSASYIASDVLLRARYLATSDSALVVTWSQLLLAQNFIRNQSHQLENKSLLTNLWVEALKSINSPSIGTSASYLACSMLICGKVAPADMFLLAPLARSFTSQGPLIISDMNRILAMHVLESVQRYNVVLPEEWGTSLMLWIRNRVLQPYTHDTLSQTESLCRLFNFMLDTRECQSRGDIEAQRQLSSDVGQNSDVAHELLLGRLIEARIPFASPSGGPSNSIGQVQKTYSNDVLSILQRRLSDLNVRLHDSVEINVPVLTESAMMLMMYANILNKCEACVQVADFSVLITAVCEGLQSLFDNQICLHRLQYCLEDMTRSLLIIPTMKLRLPKAFSVLLKGLFDVALGRVRHSEANIKHPRKDAEDDFDDMQLQRLDPSSEALSIPCAATVAVNTAFLLDHLGHDFHGSSIFGTLCRQMDTRLLLRNTSLWQIWNQLPTELLRLCSEIVLNFLVESVLQDYQFERCQELIHFVTKFLNITLHEWVVPVESGFQTRAQKVFEWLLRIVHTARLGSVLARRGLSQLCRDIMRLRESYSLSVSSQTSRGLVSMRSVLVTALNDDDLRVATEAARACMTIFDCHEPCAYHEIFSDILQVFESGQFCKGRPRLRIYVLTLLAVKDELLEGSALSQILELSRVPGLTNLTEEAIKQIRRVTRVSGGELLEAHANLIFWNWLHHHDICSFPFSLFGFDTLLRFLKTHVRTITAQLVCLGHLDVLLKLGRLVEVEERHLIENAFELIEVYTRTLLEEGQQFDGRRFVRENLGPSDYEALLSSADLLYTAFPRLSECMSCIRQLSRTASNGIGGRIDDQWTSSELFTIIATATHLEEPFQVSSGLFCAWYQESQTKFDLARSTRTARFLLNMLEERSYARQLQALRSLSMLLILSEAICVTGHVLELLLTGLSAALLKCKVDLKLFVCYIISWLLTKSDAQVDEKTLDSKLEVLVLVQETLMQAKADKQLDVLKNLRIAKVKGIQGFFDNVQHPSCTKLLDFARMSQRIIARYTETDQAPRRNILSEILRQWLQECVPSEEVVSLLNELIRSPRGVPSVDNPEFTNRVLGLTTLVGISDKVSARPQEPRIDDPKKAILVAILARVRSDSSKHAAKAESCIRRLAERCPEVVSMVVPAHVLRCYGSLENLPLVEQLRHAHTLPSVRLEVPSENYSKWLYELVDYLLHYLRGDDFYVEVAEVLHIEPDLAANCLVPLCCVALRQGPVLHSEIDLRLSNYFMQTMAKHKTMTRQHIEACISIIEAMRFAENGDARSCKAALWSQLDYFKIAEAASYHRFIPQALIALELHGLHDVAIRSTEAFRRLQKDIYQASQESDSFYGVDSIGVSLYTAKETAQHEQGGWRSLSFQIALQAADSKLAIPEEPGLHQSIGKALSDLGLDAITLKLSDGSRRIDEMEYESAWRLEQWNLPYFTEEMTPRQVLYQSLCRIGRVEWRETDQIATEIRIAHKEFGGCRHRSQIANTSVLAAFEELQELIRVCQRSTKDVVRLLNKTWQSRSETMYRRLEFMQYESIIAARQVFLNVARRRSLTDPDLILEAQLALLVSDYEKCTETQANQSVLNAVAFAEKICSQWAAPSWLRARIGSLTSRVLWNIGDQPSSIRVSQNLIKQPGDHEALSTAMDFLELGLRCASGRLEKPADILHNYLLPAIEQLKGTMSANAGHLYLRFATFCHDQLLSIDQSEDFQRIKRLREEKSREVRELEALLKSCDRSEEIKRLRGQEAKARALFVADTAEFSSIQSSRTIYLAHSIEGFLRAFSCMDSGDSSISRCVTLWLSNCSSDSATTVFAKFVSSVPSYKFLILMNQLLARISTQKELFQNVLGDLLIRMAIDHPYHALYIMYAVQYSKRSGDEPAKDRARAMSKIVSRIADEGSHWSRLISSVKDLCSSYVKLAQIQIDKKDFPSKNIPFSSIPNCRAFVEELPKLNMPPLTRTIPIDSSCDYKHVPTIVGYDKTLRLAGGISAPKVINCRASDGTVCKELVKGGNDDLRQDVVMQQVFTQVDDLFKRDRETAKRKLKIRTYKVLPLSTNTGVLEWVRHTVPLQDLLQPLHETHRPQDLGYSACRKIIADAAKKTKNSRIAAYDRVTEGCLPVMRHAFLDMFRDSTQWYDAQLAYTRSTAAISILGHVLGLGDRHLHNIILDKETGEVVHIDLGIAFEQGKTLPIPERVPFRLTRDIVDGMGILGVEGVFRRCCEFTLEMMRKEQASIKSILDVLKYDPLYSWTLSPLRRYKTQQKVIDDKATDRGEPDIGSEASRALLIVEQKLSSSLSASAVVNELIRQATDKENLALIFAGWAAWY